MYYIRITTKYNEIKLMLEDNDFYNENLQELLRQPYISGVYLRWISEKEYQEDSKYKKIRKLEKK